MNEAINYNEYKIENNNINDEEEIKMSWLWDSNIVITPSKKNEATILQSWTYMANKLNTVIKMCERKNTSSEFTLMLIKDIVYNILNKKKYPSNDFNDSNNISYKNYDDLWNN